MKQSLEPFVKAFHDALFSYGYTNDDFYVMLFLMLLMAGCAFLVAWIIYAIIHSSIDEAKAKTVVLQGTLIDKKYKGEETVSSHGTAMVSGIDGNMGVGIVNTTATSKEEFLFFVYADKVYKIAVDMQEYYAIPLGASLNFSVKYGGLSNNQLSTQLL